MVRRKRESVYATFHYLVRHEANSDGEIQTIEFTQDEFDSVVDSLRRLPEVNLHDDDVLDKVRFRQIVPIEDVQQVDGKTAFGLYRAAYWGHSYENTAVGKIPSDSVSLSV